MAARGEGRGSVGGGGGRGGDGSPWGGSQGCAMEVPRAPGILCVEDALIRRGSRCGDRRRRRRLGKRGRRGSGRGEVSREQGQYVRDECSARQNIESGPLIGLADHQSNKDSQI